MLSLSKQSTALQAPEKATNSSLFMAKVANGRRVERAPEKATNSYLFVAKVANGRRVEPEVNSSLLSVDKKLDYIENIGVYSLF